MARNRTLEMGWTHPETEDEYRITLSYEPGSEGGLEEEPSGPEIEVVSVREDREGGADRPDLIPLVETELSGNWGDRVADEISGHEPFYDASAAEEDYYDGLREERAIEGRW